MKSVQRNRPALTVLAAGLAILALALPLSGPPAVADEVEDLIGSAGEAYSGGNMKQTLQLLSRAIAMRATDGFVKIIVSDDEEQRILGMRAAGPQASTTIMSIALLMDQEKSIKDVLKSVHPHPTMTETVMEAADLVFNTATHFYKPRRKK